MRMVVEGGSEPLTVDHTLVRLLVRAHAMRARLLQDSSLTLREIAAEERVVGSYASRLVRLAFLASDIVSAILNGMHPPQLTANRLMGDEACLQGPDNVKEIHRTKTSNDYYINNLIVGGEGGIRTHGTVTRTTVFETVPFDHSGTSPKARHSPMVWKGDGTL